MSLSAALHATVATLRRRPADLLPFYLLGTAVPAVARVVAFAGLAVAVAYLEVTGRLDAAAAALSGRDLNPPDPETQPDAFAEWMAEIAPALDPLVSPVALGVLLVAGLLALAVGIALAAAVAAGQVAACEARLRDERGLTAGVAGVRRHWRAFLAARVVEGLLWVVASAVAALVVVVAAAVSSVLLVLIAPLVVLAWLAVVLVARALFVFVPVAIVVEDVGFVPAVRSSAGFVRENPVEAAGYYAIALGALLAFSTAVGVLAVVGSGPVAAPLAFLAVAPSLDLLRTGLFLSAGGSLAPPGEPVGPLGRQVSAGLRRGLREAARFVRDAPGLLLLALALGVAGAATGWLGAAPLAGTLETSIVDRLAGHVPPLAALTFLANNWTVAASTAFGGLAFGVPTALAVWFNGLLFGVVVRLEVAPAVLLAFVLPHSLVEIPAFLVAGALGGWLGLASWRAWRGRLAPGELADALERAFWVLVGLGVLLAAAGLVEGFVSPYYWRPFLGA